MPPGVTPLEALIKGFEENGDPLTEKQKQDLVAGLKRLEEENAEKEAKLQMSANNGGANNQQVVRKIDAEDKIYSDICISQLLGILNSPGVYKVKLQDETGVIIEVKKTKLRDKPKPYSNEFMVIVKKNSVAKFGNLGAVNPRFHDVVHSIDKDLQQIDLLLNQAAPLNTKIKQKQHGDVLNRWGVVPESQGERDFEAEEKRRRAEKRAQIEANIALAKFDKGMTFEQLMASSKIEIDEQREEEIRSQTQTPDFSFNTHVSSTMTNAAATSKKRATPI